MIYHVVECPVGYSCSIPIPDWAALVAIGMFLLFFAFMAWLASR